MYSFYDNLIEGIVILNEHKEPVFINREISNYLAAKRDELTLEQLNELIKIKGDTIEVKGEINSITGKCSFYEQFINGEKYFVGIVRWNEDKIILLDSLIKLVDSMEELISLRDNENKFIFVNEACANKFKVSKEEVKEILNEEYKSGTYKSFIERNDEYIRTVKCGSIKEGILDNNGEKYYYQTRKFPIINDDGTVRQIASLLKNTTFIDGVENEIIQIIKGIDKNYHIEKDYGVIFLKNISYMLTEYFETEYFDIWKFNSEKNILEIYYESLNGYSKEDIYITNDRILMYMNGEYKRIFYSGNNNIKDKYNYTAVYPIIYGNKFLGLLNIKYDRFPILKVIENDLINRLCNNIAFVMRYIGS